MARHRQVTTPTGHLVTVEAEVGDGHVVIESTWQTLFAESGPDDRIATGSVCTQRVAYINGHVVLDPDYARRLWEEVLRDGGQTADTG